MLPKVLNRKVKQFGGRLIDISVPRICFVNKMDRIGASYEYSIKSIRNDWEQIQLPCRFLLGMEANFKVLLI